MHCFITQQKPDDVFPRCTIMIQIPKIYFFIIKDVKRSFYLSQCSRILLLSPLSQNLFPSHFFSCFFFFLSTLTLTDQFQAMQSQDSLPPPPLPWLLQQQVASPMFCSSRAAHSSGWASLGEAGLELLRHFLPK